MGTSEPSNANSIGYYADILLDDWFKRSFKEYGNAKQLLKLFIEALIPERKITSLEYSSEESINQNPDKKGIRVDVESSTRLLPYSVSLSAETNATNSDQYTS